MFGRDNGAGQREFYRPLNSGKFRGNENDYQMELAGAKQKVSSYYLCSPSQLVEQFTMIKKQTKPITFTKEKPTHNWTANDL